MCLRFSNDRSAIIHSSWLDPRKVREMTIVGSKRMVVYDDVLQQEKIRIFDARVERPPHYDTFAEFHYAYHYGDTYAPYLKQEEPLKTECQHFIECIEGSKRPLSCGARGMELVKILEASSASLRQGGSRVAFVKDAEPRFGWDAGHNPGGDGNGAAKMEKKKHAPSGGRERAVQPAVAV
jgi:predicted dehydrogenase